MKDEPGFGQAPIFVELLPHARMTPGECLGREARHADTYSDVLVVGYDKDGDLVVRSSCMTRERAHFLAAQAMRWANGG